jgi:hypothetical protein
MELRHWSSENPSKSNAAANMVVCILLIPTMVWFLDITGLFYNVRKGILVSVGPGRKEEKGK